MDERLDAHPVVGAVLCGGRSSRFGSDKALASVESGTMGGLVVAAVRAAGVDPVMAVGGTAGDRLGIPTVPDLWPGEGPLGGLATALVWAGRGSVVVVPCDVPRLGADHVRALVETARSEPGQAAVAVVDGRPQPSVACWPADAGRDLRAAVKAGRRRLRHALEVVPWTGVDIDGDAVTDADTPDDLRRLLDDDDG